MSYLHWNLTQPVFFNKRPCGRHIKSASNTTGTIISIEVVNALVLVRNWLTISEFSKIKQNKA